MGEGHPHLLASREQWYIAERGIMMSGDEENKSFTAYAYSNAMMGSLTDYEESCCTSIFVKTRMYTSCDHARVHVSTKCTH